jgi:hypothetical protein
VLTTDLYLAQRHLEYIFVCFFKLITGFLRSSEKRFFKEQYLESLEIERGGVRERKGKRERDREREKEREKHF